MPSGNLTFDCGNEQTFVCSVNGGSAGWTITGLSGISVTNDIGLLAARFDRITTIDTNHLAQSSTITITGFNTADNGGTIQCINLDDGSTRGFAMISIG